MAPRWHSCSQVISELTAEHDLDNSGACASRVLILACPAILLRGLKHNLSLLIFLHGSLIQELDLGEFCSVLAVINEREGFTKAEYERAALACHFTASRVTLANAPRASADKLLLQLSSTRVLPSSIIEQIRLRECRKHPRMI